MKSHWEERLYAVVVALHPRAFRIEYGEEMKLMLNDMLKDPQTPRWRVWVALVDDIGNMLGGGVRLGTIYGLLILFFFIAFRATERLEMYPRPELTLFLIAATYILAGFTGARRAGFVRGVGAGIVAGAVSSLAFPADSFLSGHQWMGSRMFIGILLISIAEGTSLVVLGATVARFGDIQRRVRRSAVAFGSAWLAASPSGPRLPPPSTAGDR
jgi:hypothetical protein